MLKTPKNRIKKSSTSKISTILPKRKLKRSKVNPPDNPIIRLDKAKLPERKTARDDSPETFLKPLKFSIPTAPKTAVINAVIKGLRFKKRPIAIPKSDI